jgi:hypothetical protein
MHHCTCLSPLDELLGVPNIRSVAFGRQGLMWETEVEVQMEICRLGFSSPVENPVDGAFEAYPRGEAHVEVGHSKVSPNV